MKTILAIINDPNDSKAYVEYVVTLALSVNAKVHLLYAEDQSNYAMHTTGNTGIEIAQIQENLQYLINNARDVIHQHMQVTMAKYEDKIQYDVTAQVGAISVLANNIVSNDSIDMVLVEGNDEADFFSNSLNNVNAIENLDCPIWLIPKNSKFNFFNEIIYSTDYKEQDVENIRELLSFTEVFEPNITLLHIAETIDFDERVKQKGFLKILQEKTKYNKLSVKVLSSKSKSNLSELVNKYATLSKADLVVVLKEHKSFFESIFRQDQAQEIIEETSAPVLVFQES